MSLFQTERKNEIEDLKQRPHTNNITITSRLNSRKRKFNLDSRALRLINLVLSTHIAIESENTALYNSIQKKN